MKKILTISIAIILILCLVGCCLDMNPNIESSQEDMDIYFWTDEETGVQYIIFDSVRGYSGQGGITPRLNSDGTLYITKDGE